MTPPYRVCWEINVEAGSLIDAAIEAHGYATRFGSRATIYHVGRDEPGAIMTAVDLIDHDPDAEAFNLGDALDEMAWSHAAAGEVFGITAQSISRMARGILPVPKALRQGIARMLEIKDAVRETKPLNEKTP